MQSTLSSTSSIHAAHEPAIGQIPHLTALSISTVNQQEHRVPRIVPRLIGLQVHPIFRAF